MRKFPTKKFLKILQEAAYLFFAFSLVSSYLYIPFTLPKFVPELVRKIAGPPEIQEAQALSGASYIQTEACTTECTNDTNTWQQAATINIDTTGEGTTDWLVIANWEFHTNNITPRAQLQIQLDNSTTYTNLDKDFANTTDTNEYPNEGTFFMLDDISAGSHDIDLDFRSSGSTAGQTIKIKNIHIIALRLDDIFASSDYAYAENSASQTLTTSFASKLSTTITPGSEGKYLFLMSAEGSSNSGSYSFWTYLNVAGTAYPVISDTNNSMGTEPVSTTNFDSYFHGTVVNISAETTFAIYAKVSTVSGTNHFRNARIFAMRLPTFGAENTGFFSQEALAESSTASCTSGAKCTKTTLTFTPPEMADYLVLAFGVSQAASVSYYTWQELAGTIDGSEETSLQQGGHDMKQYSAGANEDYMPFSYAKIHVGLSAVSQTFTHKHWVTGGNSIIKGSTILAIRLNLTNLSPNAPTLHDVPFDNEKTGDSTPDFDFTASDPDGTANIIYQIQIDDDYAFGSPLVNCESDTSCAAGVGSFTNTVTGGDSSPFNEGEKIRFTPTTTMTTETTYYWRVRAEDDSGGGGSGSYGAWTDIQSLTYVLGTDPAEWFQTTDEQFDTGTLDGTQTTGSDSVEIGSSEPQFVIANASAGSLSTTLDIGIAGTNRLVAVFAFSEADGATALSGVTVDSNACNLVVAALNDDATKNRTELWYCDESDLGSSNGSVTITISGTGLTAGNWAVHAQLFIGISQNGPADFGTDTTSLTPTQTATISGMDVSAGGIVVMGVSNGTQGLTANWPSPLTEQSNADPSSADAVTASGIETSAQIDKTYQVTWSSAPNRSSGIAASWDAASVSSGTITSPEIGFGLVPGMDSWGEVQISATTASGNSISVQVLNAVQSPISGKTCTIQNGGTSCSVDLSDLDPTGNNATTSLEATLNDSGGGTPYLNDWIVSWSAVTGPTEITISGTLYSGEGSGPLASKDIKVSLATSSPGIFSTTTNGLGIWSVTTEQPSIGMRIAAWVDGDASVKAFTFTKASTTANNIVNLDLYQNRIIVRHEASSATSTTIADLAFCDADSGCGGSGDSDIQFTANGGTLNVFAGQELHIWTSTTFAPGGAITLYGNAATSPDGDIHIDDNATFTAGGNITLAGSWTGDTGSIFSASSYTTTFNATTSRVISANGAQFYNLTIDGFATTTGTDFGVTNAFTINSGKILEIASGRTASSTASGVVTLNGTIMGLGTLSVANSNLDTSGTLNPAYIRFDATDGDITMPARTYGGVVTPYNSGLNNRQVTMAGGTHNFSTSFEPMANGTGNITLNAASNNPTVNITNSIDFYGTGSGQEIIWSGTGTWTVSGSLIDFTNGIFSASSTNSFIMDGITDLTSGGNSFDSITLSGTITLLDEVQASGNVIVPGTVKPQNYALRLTGSSKTLQGGSGSLGALRVDGSYILSGADLTVGTTTIASGGSLTIDAGRYYISTSTLTLDGTLDGTGTTTIQHSNLTSGGTLNSNIRFDATDGDITMPARTYGGNMEFYSNSSASDRAVTMGNGTFQFNGALWGNAANTQNITLVGNTNNPTVNASSTVDFIGAGSGTEIINAGSDNWDIDGNLDISGGTFTAPSATLYLAGSYINTGGTFSHNNGAVILDGTSQQTLSGAMTASSAFYDLQIINNSGTDATTTPSVIFSGPASTTASFIITTPSVKVRFAQGAQYTFANISLNGGAAGTRVMLRSSSPGEQWFLRVSGSQSVSYVDVMDSNASLANPISASNGTNIDSGNNDYWLFYNPTISSFANQVFQIGQATTSISKITITSTATGQIIDANDLRIAIATTSVTMLWDTNSATAIFGGSAQTKVSNSVTFTNGGSVAVITINEDFAENDTLEIFGLSFGNFTSVNAATAGVLYILKDGPSDIVSDGNDDKSVTIKGNLTRANHSLGQASNKFDISGSSLSNSRLFRFKLTPIGENAEITNLVISLSEIRGILSEDITNPTIAIDYNGNGTVDSGDSLVGGTGIVSISGTTGTITFSTSFIATTSRNYILRANVSEVNPGDRINLSFPWWSSSSISASGAISSETFNSSGLVSIARHRKTIGLGSSVSVGGTPPSSGEPEEGGEEEAGEEIGGEIGFLAPTSTGSPSSQWTNPTKSYISDNVYATTTTAGYSQDYATFGFNIPSGNIIDGIEVKIEASAATAAGSIQVALSGNSGGAYTSVKSTATLTTNDKVYRLGGPSDLWEDSWDYSNFGDSFRLRVVGQPSGGNSVKIDAIQVKIYHHAAGGTPGGGGEI